MWCCAIHRDGLCGVGADDPPGSRAVKAHRAGATGLPPLVPEPGKWAQYDF
jgi:hypothetical protein